MHSRIDGLLADLADRQNWPAGSIGQLALSASMDGCVEISRIVQKSFLINRIELLLRSNETYISLKLQKYFDLK